MIQPIEERRIRDCSWCICAYEGFDMILCSNPLSGYRNSDDRGYRQCKFNITPEELEKLIDSGRV